MVSVSECQPLTAVREEQPRGKRQQKGKHFAAPSPQPSPCGPLKGASLVEPGLRAADEHIALLYCDTYVEVVGCTRKMIEDQNELHLIAEE